MRSIGIALGDVTGIGPEVTLKALNLEASGGTTQYLLIGDEGRILRLNRELGLNLPFQTGAKPQSAGRFLLAGSSGRPTPG